MNGGDMALAKLSREDPEAAKKYIYKVLLRHGGSTVLAARFFDLSRYAFHHRLKKLGMQRVPGLIRKHYDERFKISAA